jgi:hypothetical protein
VSSGHAPIAQSEMAEAYVVRISVHLDRLAQGHDPFGHLFAIERLARAARAEWLVVERQGGRPTDGRWRR